MRSPVSLCAFFLLFVVSTGGYVSAADGHKSSVLQPQQSNDINHDTCIRPVVDLVYEKVKDLNFDEAVGTWDNIINTFQGFKPLDAVKGKNGAGAHLSTPAKIKAFLQQIGKDVAANKYLLKVVCTFRKNAALHPQFAKIPAKLLKLTLITTAALDSMIKLLVNQPDDLAKLVAHFKKQRADNNMDSTLPLFTKAKIWALEMGLDNAIVAQKSGKVDPGTGKYVLPLNIMEAVIAEKVMDRSSSNPYAGVVLSRYPPGLSEIKALGRGPTTIDPKTKIVSHFPPLPVKWDDLYHTWNLNFLLCTDAWVIWTSKLLAPIVGSYHAKPGEYLHKRAIGLYLFIAWYAGHGGSKGFGEFLAPTGYKVIAQESHRQPLRKAWGTLNKESAREYMQSVKALTPQGPAMKAFEKAKAYVESLTKAMQAAADKGKAELAKWFQSTKASMSSKLSSFVKHIKGIPILPSMFRTGSGAARMASENGIDVKIKPSSLLAEESHEGAESLQQILSGREDLTREEIEAIALFV